MEPPWLQRVAISGKSDRRQGRRNRRNPPMEVAPTAHYSMGGVRAHACDGRRGPLRRRRVRSRRPRREPPRRQLARGVPRVRADRGCRGGARVGRAGRAGSRPNAIDEAREEVDAMLAQRGDEFARPLQRAPRPHVRALRRRPLRGRPARRPAGARRDPRADERARGAARHRRLRRPRARLRPARVAARGTWRDARVGWVSSVSSAQELESR
jgi:hypothetical protein